MLEASGLENCGMITIYVCFIQVLCVYSTEIVIVYEIKLVGDWTMLVDISMFMCMCACVHAGESVVQREREREREISTA